MGWSWVVLLALACGPVAGNPGGEGGGTADETGGASSGTSISASSNATQDPTQATTQDSTQATTIDPDPTHGPDTTSSDDGLIFIDTDTGCFTHCSKIDCDPWLQDCPDGEKCSAWANDGGPSWNANRCTPVSDDPDQPGEPCTVEGSAVSGIDSCALGSMCWNVDAETNTGTCVALCTGNAGDPQCAGTCDRCLITNEGVITLCLPLCHPESDECGDGEVCTMIDAVFQCMPSVGGATAGQGEVCTTTWDCMGGLRCAGASELPACEGAACCTPWCSPDDDGTCLDVPGTVCTPLDPGVPDCTAPAGSCVLPV